MKTSFSSLALVGVAAAVPLQTKEIRVEFANYSANELQRIIATTGITHVRVAPSGMRTSDLCEKAAKQLLQELSLSPTEVDAIIFVSQTPDNIMPATSVSLQHRLGLSTTVTAFDLHYGCSGYIYGLYQAALLLQCAAYRHVLICAGDVITPLLHPEDHQVRMVFGDGGSATLISRGNDSFDFAIETDGSGGNHLMCEYAASSTNHQTPYPGYLHMAGAEIMAFALKAVPKIIDNVLDMRGWNKDEVSCFFLHQANQFMLQYLAKKMKISLDRVPIAVDTIGNLGSASIPALLALTSQELSMAQRLDKVIMCGFGVGLSWGAVALNLERTIVLPLLEI